MKRIKTFLCLMSAAAILCGGTPCSVSAASRLPASARAEVLGDYSEEPTEAPTYPPASMYFYDREVHLYPGDTYQLSYDCTCTFQPDFESEAPDIVSVDGRGYITVSPDVTESTAVTITGSVSVMYNHTYAEDQVTVYVEYIAASEEPTYAPAFISIDEDEVHLTPGDTYQLGYYSNCYRPNFESDAPDIVSVDERGYITVSPDVTASIKVTITGRAAVNEGNFFSYDEDRVTVYVEVQDPTEPPTYPAAFIDFYDSEVHLRPGETYSLHYSCTMDFQPYFRSEAPDIVSVDGWGNITVSPDVTESTAVTITGSVSVVYNHSYAEDQVTVYVDVPVSAEPFTVQPGSVVLPVGEIQKITANRNIASYTIVNESIAHMTKDFVVADAPGSTWLIVEATDGETSSVRITVLPENLPDGDVNLDGSLTVADVVSLQKVLLGLETLRYTPTADMDKNGIVNIFDLILIKRVMLA